MGTIFEGYHLACDNSSLRLLQSISNLGSEFRQFSYRVLFTTVDCYDSQDDRGSSEGALVISSVASMTLVDLAFLPHSLCLAQNPLDYIPKATH